MKNFLRKALIIVSWVFYTIMPVQAEAFFLPDSGQTTCYSSKGASKVIACPAADNSLAQDGSYIINPPSYGVSDDGTVFDNNTWLMWQREDDGVWRTWNDAFAYCDNLSLGGYNDWRLPSYLELFSIANFGFPQSIDGSIFVNTKTSYWSSDNAACNVCTPAVYDKKFRENWVTLFRS